jgi:membrane protein YqaA with SNARE-associated domain
LTSPLSEAGATFDPAVPQPGDGPMKRLYRWTIGLAEKPFAPWALGVIAFMESSFFPVPPDVILIPMSLARPRRAWAYALICTIGSVLGALLGYAIGALLYDTVGQWLIKVYGLGAKMEAAEAFFHKWGALAIVLKGLTPIPFKLVTIVSGLFRFNLPLFVVLCALTRGARFFVLAVLMNVYGETIKALLERYFGLFIAALVITVVVGFYVATRLI